MNIWDEYEMCQMYADDVLEIYQNVLSLSLLGKSIVFREPSVIFFESIFNMFQGLDIFNMNDPYYYACDTHAISLYILKLLERRGIVTILECKNSPYSDIKDAYMLMGNINVKNRWNLYRIKFYKNRSLDINDLELIKRILGILHIDFRDIVLEEKNGEISCRISKRLIKNIFVKDKDVMNGKDCLMFYYNFFVGELKNKLVEKWEDCQSINIGRNRKK